MTIILKRELHLVDDQDYREVYEERFGTEYNVEKLWYDRLCTNRHVVKATLVYRNEKTGVIVDQVKLK